MTPEIHIVADANELSREAAAEFVRQATAAVQSKNFFTVALSGGSTPRSLYSLLANDAALRAQVPWDKIHFFWGDERHVPPDHADSNYRMAREAMLAIAPVPAAYMYRVEAEHPDANQVAAAYEQTLRKFFQIPAGQIPQFDLILLGMGPDGHTASLFPGTVALHEQTRLVVANWVEKFNSYRITFTLPLLNNAACVVFLVSGAEKAETLRLVLQDEEQPRRFPSQLVRPIQGRLLWLIDRAAARLLSAKAGMSV
jgi:6-phosphogluconolactonase